MKKVEKVMTPFLVTAAKNEQKSRPMRHLHTSLYSLLNGVCDVIPAWVGGVVTDFPLGPLLHHCCS